MMNRPNPSRGMLALVLLAGAIAFGGVTLVHAQVPVQPQPYRPGLGDLMTRTADLEGTLTQVPAGEAILLLSHNPDVFPRVPPSVALTLSGHTHGGQVTLRP